ncbi:unnamed protein product [Dicrocoelium dendriticum]|nr:unnamed protein product [Dicrocoelium dendriticum]
MPHKWLKNMVTGTIKSCQMLVSKLEHKWANRFPSSYRNYNLFKNGIHSTLLDVTDLMRVWSKLATSNLPFEETLPTLTRREIFVLRQVPRDLFRISPILLLAPLPGTILILPVFFLFPRIFLNRSFWTPEQKDSFRLEKLRCRLTHPAQYVLHSLIRSVSACDSSHSHYFLSQLNELESMCSQVLHGNCVSGEQLDGVRPLFDELLRLDNLSKAHVFKLCEINDIPVRKTLSLFYKWPSLRTYLELDYFHVRRIRLLQAHSMILQAEDRSLSSCFGHTWQEVQELCSLRGIHTENQLTPDAVYRLNQWIHLSLTTPPSNHSFRLHLPVFLHYIPPQQQT